VTTYSVTQSGTTVQISSSAAGFTQNSAYQYYLNSANLSLSTDSHIVTFGDGASIRLTDFSEIPGIGSSSTVSVVGIPATAEGGFDNSVNIIGGGGFLSTFDIYDNVSGSLLIDDYQPQGGIGEYFQPYAQFGYTNSSSSLTVRAPRTSVSGAGASIGADGLGSFTRSIGSYVGGVSGTPGSQYVSGGGASPWVFSLTSPTPTPVPICFVKGTLIHVGGGVYNQIEDLRTGDWIETSRGIKRIKWVAIKHYPPSVIKQFPQVLPVRILANALGDQVPFADLYVSQKHAILLNGKAYGARGLVNGRTITLVDHWDNPNGLDYLHLEFATSETIDAQGVESTSFVSVGNRSEFDNASEYEILYGDLDAPSRHDYVLASHAEHSLMKDLLALPAQTHQAGGKLVGALSTTSNKSSIPQSNTVTILDARSNDSADAALSSVRARRVMVVAATPA
jgi:hypothetical protein